MITPQQTSYSIEDIAKLLSAKGINFEHDKNVLTITDKKYDMFDFVTYNHFEKRELMFINKFYNTVSIQQVLYSLDKKTEGK